MSLAVGISLFGCAPTKKTADVAQPETEHHYPPMSTSTVSSQTPPEKQYPDTDEGKAMKKLDELRAAIKSNGTFSGGEYTAFINEDKNKCTMTLHKDNSLTIDKLDSNSTRTVITLDAENTGFTFSSVRDTSNGYNINGTLAIESYITNYYHDNLESIYETVNIIKLPVSSSHPKYQELKELSLQITSLEIQIAFNMTKSYATTHSTKSSDN